MARKILKFAHEIEQGDILVDEDEQYIVVTVFIHKDTKRVQLELRTEEDPFTLIDKYFDLNDPFIIHRTI